MMVELTIIDKKHQTRFIELVDQAKNAGITRDMIGSACGMTGNAITQYYNGNRAIGFDAAVTFSTYFNIPTVELCQKVSNIIGDPDLERFYVLIRKIPQEKREQLRRLLLGLQGR